MAKDDNSYKNTGKMPDVLSVKGVTKGLAKVFPISKDIIQQNNIS